LRVPGWAAAHIRAAVGIAVLGLLVLAPAGTSATPGLVAAYGFDEGSGTAVADASGNGNAGTAANTAWAATGKFGKALTFNGSSSRVTLPDSASRPLSGAFTLEAWVNPTSVSSAWRDVIEKGNDNYYLMATSENQGRPAGGAIVGGSYGEAVGTAVLATGTWTHLAATYDGSALRLYVNGALAATTPKSGAVTVSSSALTIGSDPFYGQYFAGSLDEVRIYDAALAPAQIQTDMATPVAAGPDAQAPSAPGTLTATAASSGRVALAWGAASDNVGVTGYQIERCQGPGCSSFAQIAPTGATTTSYDDTSVGGSTSYGYRVRAVDGAGNLGPYGNTAAATTPTADTTPPTAPTGLAATAVSATRVDLSWTAASDDVGVTGYRIERCSGAGCSSFVQIAAPAGTGTTYSDGTVNAATSYSYRVRATDAAGNLGPYGTTASGTTPAGPSGLVAAYGFDEGSGTVVADASGNGNTGTAANTSWAAAGRFGKALSFDGASSRVTVPDSASLHLSSAFTLEAWVNPATVSSAWRDLIEKGNDNYYLMATSDSLGRPAGGAIVGGATAQVFGSSTLATGTWTHLAATYDGSALRLYVNGTLAATTPRTGAVTVSSAALTLGSDPFYGQYFAGSLDEVRIYNTALGQAQIQTDMATPVGGGGSNDRTPPTVAITSPSAGAQVNDIVMVTADASDDNLVAGVQFLVDGDATVI
jgi:hypothetical protein